MNAASTLLECGLVISEKGRWCQGALAINKKGRAVEPKSVAAVKWSSTGIPYAVLKLKTTDFDKRDLDIVGQCLAHLSSAAYRLFKCTEVHVNDVFGHEATVEMFRVALRSARAAE